MNCKYSVDQHGFVQVSPPGLPVVSAVVAQSVREISEVVVDETGRTSSHHEPTVLLEAIQKTTDTRNRQYGEPEDNHGCTAAMWTLYLRRRFPSFADTLVAEDVCAMNVAQKLSRIANDVTHLDSWVDVAGFAGNAGSCVESRT